jgi:hypothetical protein
VYINGEKGCKERRNERVSGPDDGLYIFSSRAHSLWLHAQNNGTLFAHRASANLLSYFHPLKSARLLLISVQCKEKNLRLFILPTRVLFSLEEKAILLSVFFDNLLRAAVYILVKLKQYSFIAQSLKRQPQKHIF